jgi:hypothetical protein
VCVAPLAMNNITATAHCRCQNFVLIVTRG